MDINQNCHELIKFLGSGKKRERDLKEKNKNIRVFKDTLESQSLINDFIQSSYLTDVIQSILSFSIQLTQSPNFKLQNFEEIPIFFSFLGRNKIPIAKIETDMQNLAKIMNDIITNVVPNVVDDCLIFWQKIFIEILKIPTFYDLFQEKNNDDDEYHLAIDSLFDLIASLTRLKKIANEEWQDFQYSFKILSIFIKNSPYPPSPELIESFFELIETLNFFENPEKKDDKNFTKSLKILNKLISLSPISFLVNSSNVFHPPFSEKILHQILIKWIDFQKDLPNRTASSTYLLLFLTTIESLNYNVSQNFYDEWASKIIEVWSRFKNKDNIFKSFKYIPYLQTDIEFLKRAKDKSIYECLVSFILSNNKINSNLNIIWLFTAIGLYEPNMIHQEDWIKILEAIKSFNIKDAIWKDKRLLLSFYKLVSVMTDLIDSKNQWNDAFVFLIENMPLKELMPTFFSLLSKIVSKQRIDTKIAHKYQYLIWDKKANPENYSIERIRCIHVFIYYYGFADHDTRTDCFNTLLCILDSEDPLPVLYLEQLAITICSIISSHPFPIISSKKKEMKKEKIDDVYNKLKKQLGIITAKNSIEFQIETDDFYFEDIQINDEDDFDFDEIEVECNDENEFGLCNFISKNIQSIWFKNINTKEVKNKSNECFFRLFLTSRMPNLFLPDVFFNSFKNSFFETKNVDTFPSFLKILLTIIDEIPHEYFHPFFKDINEPFFEIVNQYIQYCNGNIQDAIKENSPVSWNFLQNIINDDYFDIIKLLAEFSAKCSFLIPETSDIFYDCFEIFLQTSESIPSFHLQICDYILNITLSEDHKAKVISTLEKATNNILNVYVVPIKVRDKYILELFNILKYEYNNSMEELFKTIFKYPLTPMMKLGLLKIMKNNYKQFSQIFDLLWEIEKTPFFINDKYLMIRLMSADTIVSILKIDELNIFYEYEMKIEKFDKDKFFDCLILPSIEQILNDPELNKRKQFIFTVLEMLIHLAAEVPELTMKAINIILDFFTYHKYTIFPNECIDILFCKFSTQIYFPSFLRQFIPLIIPKLENLSENLSTFPFELFYFNESNLFKAKQLFGEKAEPLIIAYEYTNSEKKMTDFFSLKINDENSIYIASYLLEQIVDSSSKDEKSALQSLYESIMKNKKFRSPIPLLSFVSIVSEKSIKDSYQLIFDNGFFTQEFRDIRYYIFDLYSMIFNSYHESVKLYYFHQFSLYISIIFEKQYEQKQTLYLDILALTINLLKFIPENIISQLLIDISLKIPEKFKTKMFGFVKNIEDICDFLGDHECLNNFFERFPKLINKILIFDFLKERQLETRTPLMEFKRIAKTKRLNQESINILLTVFIEDSESIAQINELPNNFKRIVINEVYKYAQLNPHTLALHLYSEMYLNFIHIHPSPIIVENDIDQPILLFKKLIELARDENPSINRSALAALHNALSKEEVIPDVVKNDSFLMCQLRQYEEFAHPDKEAKKPDKNSPWICTFVYKYIEQMVNDCFCAKFKNIVSLSEELCQLLFPFLFIDCSKSPLFNDIYQDFIHFAENPNQYYEECKVFISAFNYQRIHIFKDNYEEHSKNDWYLDWFKRPGFNFQKIMEVCLQIGDPYLAYQFAELAHEKDKINEEPLNRIFTHIGIDELKYGLDHDFSNPLSVADLHRQEGRIEKSLILYDSGNNVQMMSSTLCKLHLYNLVGNMKIKLTDENIESLWHLRKWNVSSEIMREIRYETHSENLFAVLQSFATNNEETIKQRLINFDQKFHFKTDSSVFTQLSDLLDASALQWFHAITFKDNSKLNQLFPDKIIDNYHQYLRNLNQFSHQFYKISQSAIALHGVFFCILNDIDNDSLPIDTSKFYSDVISNSINHNDIESAQYFISLLRETQKNAPQLSDFEQLRVLYSDNPHHAVSLLQKKLDQILIRKGQLKSDEKRKYFKALVKYTFASWCANTNYLSSDQIYEQLNNIIEECNQKKLAELMADAEFTLARAYHNQHLDICDYFKSIEFKKINGICNFEKTIIDIYNDTKSKIPNQKIQNQESQIPKQIYNLSREDYKVFSSINEQYINLFSTTIVNAIENYMNVLIHSSKYDLECIFSMIGIWFKYSYTEYAEIVQNVPNLIPTMEKKFSQINPSKFLPLFYQLSARIDYVDEKASSQEDDYKKDFQDFLHKMIISICIKDPNECFPILYCMNECISNENKKKIAVNELITDISKELPEQWNDMKDLLQDYINISLSKIKKLKSTTKEKKYVSIITKSNNIGIHSSKINRILNGNNKPKLLEIIGTDGQKYFQVVKKSEDDDIRQDSVIEQLFVLASKLLSKMNPNLSIRHYKVIPIKNNFGVIEFVESIVMFDYIKNAYEHYYNDGNFLDSKIKEFNIESSNYHKLKFNRNDFISYFKGIKKEMKPVLHFFFIEKFTNQSDWFVSRLRYCRHTATNSMVGYIIGIGDRHLNNILLDYKTGEIIHIDLGYAFDQSKSLSIKETVPFRLTDEIIDGMGWMGKEGIFRKTCEETMHILRNCSEYLLMVLEVFLSDPLQNWIINKNILNDISPPDENLKDYYEKNKFAESAIITCTRKLKGRETSELFSIEGQVSKLINDATNDENLALIYWGWKPFL